MENQKRPKYLFDDEHCQKIRKDQNIYLMMSIVRKSENTKIFIITYVWIENQFSFKRKTNFGLLRILHTNVDLENVQYLLHQPRFRYQYCFFHLDLNNAYIPKTKRKYISRVKIQKDIE